MVMLKNGDEIMEVESNISFDEVDILEKVDDDLEDTLEMPIVGDNENGQ